MCHHYRSRLSRRRPASPAVLVLYALILERGRAPADLLPVAPLVSPFARLRLPDRVSLTLDAAGWIDRRRRDPTRRGVPAGRARAFRRQCSVPSPNAVLVQLE